MIQKYKARFESKVSEGKTYREALYEMAMTECLNAPKNEITPRLLEWMKMNNLRPEQFDTICDSPSKRMSRAQNREDSTSTLIGYITTTSSSIPTHQQFLYGLLLLLLLVLLLF